MIGACRGGGGADAGFVLRGFPSVRQSLVSCRRENILVGNAGRQSSDTSKLWKTCGIDAVSTGEFFFFSLGYNKFSSLLVLEYLFQTTCHFVDLFGNLFYFFSTRTHHVGAAAPMKTAGLWQSSWVWTLAWPSLPQPHPRPRAPMWVPSFSIEYG